MYPNINNVDKKYPNNINELKGELDKYRGNFQDNVFNILEGNYFGDIPHILVGETFSIVREYELFEINGLDSDECIDDLIEVFNGSKNFVDIARLAKNNIGVCIDGSKNNSFKVYTDIMNLIGFNLDKNYLENLLKK